MSIQIAMKNIGKFHKTAFQLLFPSKVHLISSIFATPLTVLHSVMLPFQYDTSKCALFWLYVFWLLAIRQHLYMIQYTIHFCS